jgi:cob(I)alamin adenosyltransferase
VQKDCTRVKAYGTVDELSSQLGVVLVNDLAESLRPILRRMQNDLFHLGSDLCILEEDKEKFSVPQIEERHVVALEELMDRLSESLQPLANFILPGGSPAAAHLHVARALCRRAERDLLSLSREEAIGGWGLRYLNRLSDALFVMARYQNFESGSEDILWDSHA